MLMMLLVVMLQCIGVLEEELWSAYSAVSAPCLVNYDYVVHLEDREELEFFLAVTNLTSAGSDLTSFR